MRERKFDCPTSILERNNTRHNVLVTERIAGQMRTKKFAAEAVLFVHFVWVVFAVFGGFLGILDIRWLWVHAPVVIWSSVVNLAAWTCPLTPVEKRLRTMAGQSGYSGGFVNHYIGPLVYPGGMPRRLELVAGISIVAWNAIVYAFILAGLPLLRQ